MTAGSEYRGYPYILPPSEGSGTREYDEQRIQQEINAIFERRARQRGEEPPQKSEKKKDDPEKKTSPSGQGSGKSGQVMDTGRRGERNSGKRTSTVRSRSEMIRTLLRKEFDDEPITLDQVITEMGEITIHGKIINFDTREIGMKRRSSCSR